MTSMTWVGYILFGAMGGVYDGGRTKVVLGKDSYTIRSVHEFMPEQTTDTEQIAEDTKTARYEIRLSSIEKQKIVERGGAEYLRRLVAKDEKENAGLRQQA
jgi:hypothetical protein